MMTATLFVMVLFHLFCKGTSQFSVKIGETKPVTFLMKKTTIHFAVNKKCFFVTTLAILYDESYTDTEAVTQAAIDRVKSTFPDVIFHYELFAWKNGQPPKTCG